MGPSVPSRLGNFVVQLELVKCPIVSWLYSTTLDSAELLSLHSTKWLLKPRTLELKSTDSSRLMFSRASKTHWRTMGPPRPRKLAESSSSKSLGRKALSVRGSSMPKTETVQSQSPGDKGEVTISTKDADLTLLLSGKLAAQQAYFQGRLKVQGNMGLAMKLQELMKSNAGQLKSKL